MTNRFSGSTKLSSSMTVAHYRALEQVEDCEELGHFIVERFEERYFKPIEDSASKHGFTILAVCCLVIETLESFYQGLADTKKSSARMFRDFFRRDTSLRVFDSLDDWFFLNIRCGILHQGETRGGWRILRSGPLLDRKAKTINATRFLRELRKAVMAYSAQLKIDDKSWSNFRRKMNAICVNCE
jgi:hypothetical protein